MQRRPLLLGMLAIVAALSLAPSGDPAPGIDVLLDTRLRTPLSKLADRVPLAAGEDFRVVELGRDEGTSHHVVAIRNAEVPHRHDRHDLLVVMVRGEGTWRVGEQTELVGQGSILYVPRGTVHAFANHASDPAIAYAVYTPAYDGKDRVEVGTDLAHAGD